MANYPLILLAAPLIAAGIKKDNITGVQFHPEKSHQYGMQFLRNYYAEITQ